VAATATDGKDPFVTVPGDRRSEVARTLAEPVPQPLSLLDQFGLWGNLGVSLLGFTGAIFVLQPGGPGTPELSLAAALTAIVAGTVFGTAVLALAGLPGARVGAPAMVLLQLLIQFQGIFAEYEKAQLAERYRRGKAYRARSGSVNVLGGAPFGYRYVRKTPEAGARYEVIEHEAVLVAEMFRRYADDGATIADLARWLTSQGVPTRTGKHRWDRSVIWGMLRNPAYAGRAVFGKTQVIHEQPGLNRVARLQGRTTPRAVKTVDRPREQWTEIAVAAIVSEDTFARVGCRLAENKRFASRNSKVPSLLQGLAACSACGYAYYRGHTTTTAGNKIYYYRCLGSDDYRYQGGRVCGNKPVRADYLDTVVWDHITGLLAGPALIRAEIDRRLAQARTSDPVPRHQAAQTARARAGQGSHVGHRDDRGLLRAADHHRRAAR